MSKKSNIDNISLGEVMPIKAYVEYLKKERGIDISRQGIHYQLEKTDNIDYCEWHNNKLVIINNKSINFKPKGE